MSYKNLYVRFTAIYNELDVLGIQVVIWGFILTKRYVNLGQKVKKLDAIKVLY
ncbi:hypothetical protein [Clostridioides difficile]|uniref:hypothetical protein n=1 Tax=Clostridioides difficile TaxID=1496 RepID=UPI00155A259E|nr:hypothetical protein [Clostridioides difficile]MCJ0377507.1 hypothetical protein [Clostridioides difficile]MDX5712374.1 hypothetical protein [Clostridioides difficile]HDX7057532.1 hypothetical protein [Clostridioides difficile]HDX7069350.1 hypothetical protein [Clostridioides difficile]HEL3037743.1 hypothetical protein [Clostridioides difficile]